ncbi:MAG: fused MFS/spermidine synthase [Acidimicrobiia bacterium]|nr:fused MFS/spermidine synthase [Acidimicrobiia bacterium]
MRAAVRYPVVVGGLVTLGLQVLAPRLLHPYFGSGTATAAAVVAAALAGLAVGYRWGGRPTTTPGRLMSTTLTGTAAYLILLAAILRSGVVDGVVPASLWLVPVAVLLVGVPSLLLGTVSPLAIQALGDGHHGQGSSMTTDTNTVTAASVFGLGTIANVVGGLVSAFYLAPYVGISLSLGGFGVLLATAALVAGRIGAVQPVTEPEGARVVSTTGGGRDTFTVYGYLVLAFYSGVASVALEVNASRMLASYFGPTTGLWAAVLSVSLGGLALGYSFGGVIALPALGRILPFVVGANALWLVGATWVISLLEPSSGLSFGAVGIIALLAFGPAFVLFGMESQILVGAVWQERGTGSMSAAAASVFAISSIGGIIGALLGLAYLIPLLGMSGMIRLFVAGYLAVLAVTWRSLRPVSLALALFVALVPLPDWRWRGQSDRLVAQEEGRFQTIRVYTDDASYLRFHLGPTYESEVTLATGEPRFGYATTILGLAGDVSGKRALVIGGAGHALANALENRGATVTEVELDPIVRDVSDEHFGLLEGETVIDDGRRFVTTAESDTYDVIVIDAFAGPRYVPPHLTTVEFFDEVNRILTPDGTMYLNMISAIDGPGSGPFKALSSATATSFPASGYVRSGGNIVVVGSRVDLAEGVTPVGVSRTPNTDDKNPMDVLLEFAR